jgi:hypothetical protein
MNQRPISRFFIYVVLFLAMILGISGVVVQPKLLMTNPYFNGAIIGIWCLGVGMTLISMWRLSAEDRMFQKKAWRFVRILRPLMALYERSPAASPTDVEQTLDRCYHSQNHELLRYLAGSLIFLGLLGTLWGLSETIVSIADVIGHLPGQDAAEGFLDTLKLKLQEPLAGMGVAFSSSLLGVGGTLTMGFCLMQLDRAKEAFFQKADFWASQMFPRQNDFYARNSDAGGNISMDRWADGVERLGRLYIGAEKRQQDLLDAVIRFGEKTQTVVDIVKMQHFSINKWAEDQAYSRQVLGKMVDKMDHMAVFNDDGLKTHLAVTSVAVQEILRHLNDYAWVDVLRQELAMARRLDAENRGNLGRRGGGNESDRSGSPQNPVT